MGAETAAAIASLNQTLKQISERLKSLNDELAELNSHLGKDIENRDK